jgi:hypothetical protein
MATLQLSHAHMLSIERLNLWHITSWLALYSKYYNPDVTLTVGQRNSRATMTTMQKLLRQLRSRLTRGCEVVGHKTTVRETEVLHVAHFY